MSEFMLAIMVCVISFILAVLLYVGCLWWLYKNGRKMGKTFEDILAAGIKKGMDKKEGGQ